MSPSDASQWTNPRRHLFDATKQGKLDWDILAGNRDATGGQSDKNYLKDNLNDS
jgi:hypothetical protein